MSMLPEKDPLLEKLGEIFFNVGMCSQAVDAYSKVTQDFVEMLVKILHVNLYRHVFAYTQFGVPQSAIDVCIKLNQWDRALQLTSQHSSDVPVNQIFENYAGQLMRKNRILETIQLYRKAEKYSEAADLLFEVSL